MASSGLVALVLCVVVGPAMASPLDLFGFGGQSPGLAGTGVATASDYDAVFLNPAGLGGVPPRRVSLGTMGADFALSLGERDAGVPSPLAVVFGGALPIPLGGALRDRIGLGLGFHVPTESLDRARHPAPGTPVYALLASRSYVVAVQVAVGVRLSPRWRVGAGVNALAALSGGIDVATDAAGRFTTRSQQQLITHFAPVLGVRHRLRRDLALGAVVRAESRSDYDILVTSDLGDAVPVMIPPIRIAGTSQYTPLTVAIEAAWSPRARWQLAGQLTYQHWAAYPLPTENPVVDAPPQQQPGFHDTLLPRVSVERGWDTAVAHVSGRAGYAFVWSPAPEMDARQSLLDNHRHVLAAGVGAALRSRQAPLRVDLWVQLHALVPRTHVKDLDLYEPGETVPFHVLRTGGRVVAGGLTMGVDL